MPSKSKHHKFQHFSGNLGHKRPSLHNLKGIMMSFLCLILCLIWHCILVQGFLNSIASTRVLLQRPSLLRVQSTTDDDSNNNSGGSYKAGQGFGKKKAEPSPETIPVSTTTDTETVATTMKTSETQRLYETPRARREAELDDKIRRLKEEEDLLATDTSVGAVPELVANRMITRIALLAGIPVFGGLAIFVGAFFYSKKYDVVIQPSIIAYATQLPFVLGLVGITYGILSASWDEEPGSFLGFKEAKINFERIKEGLVRTGDTAKLKEDIEKEKTRLGRKD